VLPQRTKITIFLGVNYSHDSKFQPSDIGSMQNLSLQNVGETAVTSCTHILLSLCLIMTSTGLTALSYVPLCWRSLVLNACGWKDLSKTTISMLLSPLTKTLVMLFKYIGLDVCGFSNSVGTGLFNILKTW